MTFSLHLLFATIGFLVLVERVPRWRRLPSRLLRPHVGTDLVLFAVSWLALAPVSLAWVAWATGALHGAGGAAPPLWLEAIVAIVLLDAGNYAVHWLMHRHEALWRIHAVHHSSPTLDWLATFRSHPLEQILRRAVA